MLCKWCEKKITTFNKTTVFYDYTYHYKCFSEIKGNHKPDTFNEFDENFWNIMEKHNLFRDK